MESRAFCKVDGGIGLHAPRGTREAFEFYEKVNPCAGLQFTLSDVILALALIDPCFTASPVKVNVNDKGFLQTACDPKSNVYYYDRKDYQKFVEILLMRVKI